MEGEVQTVSRYIDADALMQNIPSEEMIAKIAIAHAPSIKTKQIKYFDEDEKVWKTGEVIVHGEREGE